MEFISRWLEDGTLKTVYMACAAAGGAVLILQTLLQLFGIGDADGGVDLAEDVDGGEGSLGILSVRALAAFVTFFGLTGWAGVNAGWSPFLVAITSVGVGVAVMLLVVWIISFQKKLQAKGNLDPLNAVGTTAKVYLRIPENRTGVGKITVAIQGRTHEYNALTAGAELPTGSEVRVVRMTTEDTFEVEPTT